MASDVVRALVDVATGKIPHLFRGSCPDGIEGPDARDPECPACHAIDVALTQPAASGEVAPVCHGMRRKGSTAIIGLVPNKIADKPATSEAYNAEFEEVPLYTASPQPDADTVRDAERYRWLRARRGKNNRWPHIAQTARQDFDTEEVPQLFDRRFGDKFAERLDAAIDSAIKGEK